MNELTNLKKFIFNEINWLLAILFILLINYIDVIDHLIIIFLSIGIILIANKFSTRILYLLLLVYFIIILMLSQLSMIEADYNLVFQMLIVICLFEVIQIIKISIPKFEKKKIDEKPEIIAPIVNKEPEDSYMEENNGLKDAEKLIEP